MNNEYVTVDLRVHRIAQTPDADRIHLLLQEWDMQLNAQEVFWVVAYDAGRNLRRVVEVARGSYNDVVVAIPSILSAVLLSGTDRFEMVHNHPSGDVEPSEMDITLTKKVMAAANTCGLTFEDHIIIAPPKRYFSMTAAGIITMGDRVKSDRAARIRKPNSMAASFFVTCRVPPQESQE